MRRTSSKSADLVRRPLSPVDENRLSRTADRLKMLATVRTIPKKEPIKATPTPSTSLPELSTVGSTSCRDLPSAPHATWTAQASSLRDLQSPHATRMAHTFSLRDLSLTEHATWATETSSLRDLQSPHATRMAQTSSLRDLQSPHASRMAQTSCLRDLTPTPPDAAWISETSSLRDLPTPPDAAWISEASSLRDLPTSPHAAWTRRDSSSLCAVSPSLSPHACATWTVETSPVRQDSETSQNLMPEPEVQYIVRPAGVVRIRRRHLRRWTLADMHISSNLLLYVTGGRGRPHLFSLTRSSGVYRLADVKVDSRILHRIRIRTKRRVLEIALENVSDLSAWIRAIQQAKCY